MECSEYIKSIWSSVSFKAIVSFLFFCLGDLSNAVNGVLNSSVIVFLSMSSFMYVYYCFIYLDAPILAELFTIVRSACWIIPFMMI